MLKTKRKHAKKNCFRFAGTKRFAPMSRLRELGAGSACRGALAGNEKSKEKAKAVPYWDGLF